MRGHVDDQSPLFPVFSVEDRIRADHPRRDIERRGDRIPEGMSAKFAQAYSSTGRPRVPPERLLKALLLVALDSVRSERQLCERIDTDLLFRWFREMHPGENAFDATTFPHNRKRLDDHDRTRTSFDAVVGEALTAGLCGEHSRVAGTLLESFAAAKSFRAKTAGGDEPKDANGFQPRTVEVDFHGEKRANETPPSQTDPEAKLYRKSKGQGARLAHMGHTLGENRNGLSVTITATEANGTAERSAAPEMLDELPATHDVKPTTRGGDKGFDSGEFFQELELRAIEPHVPLVKAPRNPESVPGQKHRPGVEARQRMKARMASAGDRRSPKCRKKIEEGFGWRNDIAGRGRSRVVGRWTLKQLLEIGAAAFNLVRLRTLKPA